MSANNSRGFTIIELTLSMSFVALLLISIATLSIQLTRQYSRGLTLKEMSQSGTEASNDIKRTFAQAQLRDDGIGKRTLANGGTALCTGSYSYIANSPASLENNADVVKVGTSTATAVPARLAKVRDPTRELCSSTALEFIKPDVSELLSSGSRQLVVHTLNAEASGIDVGSSPPTGLFSDEFKKGRGIYTVTLTIGTGVGSEIIADACKAPNDVEANLDFCAIDTFKFTTRVGSSSL